MFHAILIETINQVKDAHGRLSAALIPENLKRQGIENVFLAEGDLGIEGFGSAGSSPTSASASAWLSSRSKPGTWRVAAVAGILCLSVSVH